MQKLRSLSILLALTTLVAAIGAASAGVGSLAVTCTPTPGKTGATAASAVKQDVPNDLKDEAETSAFFVYTGKRISTTGTPSISDDPAGGAPGLYAETNSMTGLQPTDRELKCDTNGDGVVDITFIERYADQELLDFAQDHYGS